MNSNEYASKIAKNTDRYYTGDINKADWVLNAAAIQNEAKENGITMAALKKSLRRLGRDINGE